MTSPRILGERYEVGGVLGSGGMAEVHRGRDVRLGRSVAIKILRAELTRDPSFLTRFRREAQASASLNHPSIVAVYDTGEDPEGPTPYIVMEFVDGRTLRDLLRSEGQLAPRRAMEITADICAALDFSHRGGIVHRDVKPGNVMITDAGTVKVMDFGIARAMTDSAATITSTAQVIGTAQYLSPEQARGESVDARSDVYSTGCLLYELVVGAPPFTGDSPVAIAYQHVREQPVTPSERNPEIPEAVDRIILRAMAKSPEQRYQTAGEMQTDLARALAGEPVQAAPLPNAGDRTSVVAPVATTVLAGAGAGVAAGAELPDRTTTYDKDADRRKRQRALGFGLLALGVIALFVAAAIFGPKLFNGNDRNTTRPPTSSSSTSVPPTTRAPSSRPSATRPGSSRPRSTAPSKTTRAPVRMVSVPSLNGLTPDEAAARLKLLGLKLGQVRRQASPDGDKNKIIGQSPTNGTVPAGTAIRVIVGSGRATVAVPPIVGLTLDSARAALAGVGLKASDKPVEKSDKRAAGTVIDSSPTEGTDIAKGDTVMLTISTGKILLPSVYGKSYDYAAQILRGAGFTDISRRDREGGETPDSVVDQNPVGGTQQEPSTPITLTVAVAPPSSAPPSSSPPTSASSSAAPSSSPPTSASSSPSPPSSPSPSSSAPSSSSPSSSSPSSSSSSSSPSSSPSSPSSSATSVSSSASSSSQPVRGPGGGNGNGHGNGRGGGNGGAKKSKPPKR